MKKYLFLRQTWQLINFIGGKKVKKKKPEKDKEEPEKDKEKEPKKKPKSAPKKKKCESIHWKLYLVRMVETEEKEIFH